MIQGARPRHKTERHRQAQLTTTACWLRAEDRPSTQIAKGFCGRAFVSVLIRPVSTPSLRSVGHSPHVHGTQAQYKLATSTCLNVVRNGYAQGRKAKMQITPQNKQRIVRCKTIISYPTITLADTNEISYYI